MAAALDAPVTTPLLPSFPYAAWRALVDRVRRFNPDVVILVARKMPRLAERLGFDIGPGRVVVSDLAIPFVYRLLAGARVAVLDDVINVGSTVDRAVRSVRACHPAGVHVFALGGRNAGACRRGGMECVWDESLDEGRYKQWTEAVPAAIRALPKPYDLEFPIIPCRLSPPYRAADDVLGFLTDQFGRDRVRMCPSSGRASDPVRITVDVPGRPPGMTKLRLYLDQSGCCTVVPFAIPAVLDRASLGEPTHPAARGILAAATAKLVGVPLDASLWPEEPAIRAALFARSLDFGLRQVGELGELLTLAREDEPLSFVDAGLLFGPVGPVDLAAGRGGGDPLNLPESEPGGSGVTVRPFVEHLAGSGEGAALLERVRCRAGGAGGFALLSALVSELAVSSGASDPDGYTLEWPYSREEVRADPYLRLRVGPTFEDLVCLFEGTAGARPEAARCPVRHQVSALLDMAIDDGAVVPTLARYAGTFYRVYRKGESDARDRAVDRALYAWHAADRPMSLTRFTKLNAILSFSAELPQLLVPDTLTRGNVAALEAGVLDTDGPEIARYLRDTGRLRECDGATRDDRP